MIAVVSRCYNSLGLTSLELGDIYLTVISSNNFSPTLRKIDFSEFWEALVRSALVAFKDKTKVLECVDTKTCILICCELGHD